MTECLGSRSPGLPPVSTRLNLAMMRSPLCSNETGPINTPVLSWRSARTAKSWPVQLAIIAAEIVADERQQRADVVGARGSGCGLDGLADLLLRRCMMAGRECQPRKHRAGSREQACCVQTMGPCGFRARHRSGLTQMPQCTLPLSRLS